MIESISRRQALAAAMTAPAALARSERTFRTGGIGTGNRAGAHLRACRDLPQAQVVALADVASQKMEAVNATLPAKAAQYTDRRELIKDRNVEMVVIATPNFLHHEMAIAALRAGKDVLVEKPIAISYELAREIQREAARSGRLLAVGMQRRYRELDRHIQQIAASGLIGTVV